MLRKLPITASTPRIAAVPARAAELLCPQRQLNPPRRGALQKIQVCYYPKVILKMQTETATVPPRLVWVEYVVTGPQTCVTTWRASVGQ